LVKALLIVMDGAGDRALKELGGKTPLEVARKPNMDGLAARGITGLMYAIAPGIRPGSDTAHLAIFGYDPYATYSGRGAFEALGAGLELGEGDVAFRTNFATVNEDWVVVDRRAGRYIEGAEELEKALNEIRIESHPEVEIVFKHTVEHRGVLILRGTSLSNKVSDVDPHKLGVRVPKAEPLDNDPSSKVTAEVLNEFTKKSYEVLSKHPLNKERERKGLPPANIVLARGAGKLPKVPSLREKYGLKAATIAGITLIKGVSRALGMEVLEVKGATGGLNTDVNAKFSKALEALNSGYDLVFLHIKGTDAASHDGNVRAKVSMIERIDRALGGFLSKVDLSDLLITITSDHATPITVRDHTGDAVPILMAWDELVSDEVSSFSERACMRGGLHVIRGTDLMNLIANFLGKLEKFGE